MGEGSTSAETGALGSAMEPLARSVPETEEATASFSGEGTAAVVDAEVGPGCACCVRLLIRQRTVFFTHSFLIVFNGSGKRGCSRPNPF